MNLDEQQLNARFREGFDLASNQVLTLNKPSTDVDESKPWCRFTISLGDKFREELGANPAFTQLGGIYLQVFIPKTLGIKAGEDMIEKFDNLFCDWTSPDAALNIGRQTRNMTEKDTYYQVTVRYAFRSLRKRN